MFYNTKVCIEETKKLPHILQYLPPQVHKTTAFASWPLNVCRASVVMVTSYLRVIIRPLLTEADNDDAIR